ncbi:molecular chaperone DnaJ [Gloeocapsa sp. PCC 73106]|uniref:molecular chaperone DnaJ n=1 Tax=Gloeocapsa sp. PCC 73106 TaxID=102232 RepID=UPI0002ACB83E|nr:molecular chaperone DnaJ [Gloeocapsa sp. PCC 73106]ELR99761.1 chaperone protein DnaJ [Gloeocapsa sp. PCC 73106]
MPGDYYQILGVSKDASKEEIKKAYRRLARQYHPDVNKEAGAEERFKQINRAYEILSEPDTRDKYDRFGEAGVTGAGGSGYEYTDFTGFADIFESIFSGFGGTSQQRSTKRGPVRGDDLRLDFRLEFKEAIFGGEKEIKIPHLENCQVCNGSGAKAGTGVKTCSVCNGTGQVRRATRTPFGTFAQVSTCPNCNGEGQVIEQKCEACGGAGRLQVTKKLKINIPPGVDNGTRLRVSGEGDAGARGGPSGDLYVFVSVEPDKEFRREGINILSEITVSYLQAILGCRLNVKTVDGTEEINIPSGTQPNTVLTLEDHGVPKLGNEVSRGDHLLTIKVEIPSKLSNEEKELLQKLATLKGESTGKGGFFGGIFHK